MEPDLAGTMPHNVINKVDFPAPLDPIIETISPLLTSIEILSKA